MKTICFVATILLFSTVGFSQESEPVPFDFDANPEWKNITHFVGLGFDSFEEEYLIIDGNSTINDIHYFKLRYSDQFQSGIKGYIREENRQVFFIPETAMWTCEEIQDEYILYDFNLEIGDKVLPFRSTIDESSDSLTVVYVDTIIVDVSERKRMILENEWGSANSPLYWIEGIGSSRGLLYSGHAFFGSNDCFYQGFYVGNSALSCYWKTDLDLAFPSYINTDYIPGVESIDEECNITFVGIEELKAPELKLFPNPVSDKLMLELPSNVSQRAEVVIFDNQGKAVLRQFYNSNQAIDVSDLKDGLYRCALILNEDKIASTPFVKL